MCSIQGGAIERIAAAIDRLSASIQAMTEAELTARVAGIWLMVGELDPELTRRQQLYITAPDGTPT